MLYIIDPTVEFRGHCENTMSDDVHAGYAGGLTFEEYKEYTDNPNLVVITAGEMEQKMMEYRASLMGEFEEISKEKYWWYLGCVPPIRYSGRSFFVGECDAMDLHRFCFESNGKYYSALRGVKTPIAELQKEISEFIRKIKTLEIEVLDLESASRSAPLFNFMEEHKIGDILDFFEGDPDMLMISGTKVFFTTIEMPNQKMVIYHDQEYSCDKKEAEKMLALFFSDDYEKQFSKRTSSWDEFTDNCIAYRGGRGDFYTIWEYVPKPAIPAAS